MADDRVEEMRRLWLEEELSYREIGAKYGISGERVRQLIGNMGHRPSRKDRELREARIAAHARVCAGESTVAEEAENLGLTVKHLRSYLADTLGLHFPSTSPLHGTPYRYSRGCRCDECKQAVRDEYEDRKARGPSKHGTESAYSNYGCRCRRCVKAHSKYMKDYRSRRKRRLQKAGVEI